ncbi:hypothetical protein PRUPE_6G021900 [Prunus persica]|uniref:Uncharacterized protein n=1 Tax=Prunus persica TaxID=3760 RepID=A0A251NIX8_PRUPE|nr:hypothetical protein PRUPE_6G021900 [Prunus persica]
MLRAKPIPRHMCGPAHKGHADLTSFPPSSSISLVVPQPFWRGVLNSLLGWALPHKAPPSGHKRPLVTHMRGTVLAFPDHDRSYTRSVRDRPTQLCID